VGLFDSGTERQSYNPRLLWDWVRELNADRTADAHQHYCDGLIDPLTGSAACCHDSERTFMIMRQNLESYCKVKVKRFFVLYLQEMHKISVIESTVRPHVSPFEGQQFR